MAHDSANSLGREVVHTPDPTPPPYAIIANFAGPNELLHAATKIYDAGYRQVDSHSPFPIHGMDDALHEKRSRVSYIAALGAIGGGGSLLLLVWWVTTIAYPLVISGKPFFSYQAFFPPIFAITILSAAFGALLGFMYFMKLSFNHPLFNSKGFGKFSDDGFIISIEAADPNYNEIKTMELLKSLGATDIEVVGGE